MPFLGDVLVPWRVLNLLKNTSVDLDSYWPAEVSVVIFNPSNFKGHFFCVYYHSCTFLTGFTQTCIGR